MKVAMVKQMLDTHGPWRSLAWSDTSAVDILNYWPGRALFWAMTVLLEADWYVLPQQRQTWYTWMSGVSQPADRAVIEKYTESVCDPKNIPWDAYDVVISLDPCLKPPRRSRTLFSYYMNEHVDVLYTVSQRQVLSGYDLFLDHLLGAAPNLKGLPQAVAFPYLWETAVTRPIVKAAGASAPAAGAAESVFIEWRTLALLLGDTGRQALRYVKDGQPATLGMSEVEAARLAGRLERYFGLPVRFRLQRDGMYNHLPDPPNWGELRQYLTPLAGCGYYISLFSFGAGQSLVDAAAMGALVIGSSALAYHRLVCHPSCLCAGLDELPQRVRQLSRSPDLRAEALAWQEQALRQSFAANPLRLLADAADRKRRLV